MSRETEALVAIHSTTTAAIVALAILLGRTREKVIRIEEWIRLYERTNGRTNRDK